MSEPDRQAKPLPRWMDAVLLQVAKRFECTPAEVEEMRQAARADLVAASRFYAHMEKACATQPNTRGSSR